MELLSDRQGRINFAVIAGLNLGGSDERMDDLHLMYDQLARERAAGIAFVIGPVFDPHAVVSRGLQLRYLAEHYPRVAGISTYCLVPRGSRGFESAMRAAGRDDWDDFADPVVDLRRAGSEAHVPLLLNYDEDHEGFDFARYRDLARYVHTMHLVAAFGGQRSHSMDWRDGQLLVGVGVFSGREELGDPVGCTVFDLVVNNPLGTLEQVGHPTEFWDFNDARVRC